MVSPTTRRSRRPPMLRPVVLAPEGAPPVALALAVRRLRPRTSSLWCRRARRLRPPCNRPAHRAGSTVRSALRSSSPRSQGRGNPPCGFLGAVPGRPIPDEAGAAVVCVGRCGFRGGARGSFRGGLRRAAAAPFRATTRRRPPGRRTRAATAAMPAGRAGTRLPESPGPRPRRAARRCTRTRRGCRSSSFHQGHDSVLPQGDGPVEGLARRARRECVPESPMTAPAALCPPLRPPLRLGCLRSAIGRRQPCPRARTHRPAALARRASPDAVATAGHAVAGVDPVAGTTATTGACCSRATHASPCVGLARRAAATQPPTLSLTSFEAPAGTVAVPGNRAGSRLVGRMRLREASRHVQAPFTAGCTGPCPARGTQTCCRPASGASASGRRGRPCTLEWRGGRRESTPGGRRRSRKAAVVDAARLGRRRPRRCVGSASIGGARAPTCLVAGGSRPRSRGWTAGSHARLRCIWAGTTAARVGVGRGWGRGMRLEARARLFNAPHPPHRPRSVVAA